MAVDYIRGLSALDRRTGAELPEVGADLGRVIPFPGRQRTTPENSSLRRQLVMFWVNQPVDRKLGVLNLTDTSPIRRTVSSVETPQSSTAAITSITAPESGSATVDSLNIYLQEIDRHPLLTEAKVLEFSRNRRRGLEARQEMERLNQAGAAAAANSDLLAGLQQQIDQGEESKRRLVESNLKFVVTVAKQYRGRGLPLLDLIQEGNIGLIKAVENFDENLGFKFTTYAFWKIRKEIGRAIELTSKTIRIPVHVYEFLTMVNDVSNNLNVRLGRPPSIEELSKELHVTRDYLKEKLDSVKQPITLDQPVGEKGKRTIAETLPGNDPTANQEAEHSNLTGILKGAIEKLPQERWKDILNMSFGLDNSEPMTDTAIGRVYGVSYQAIGQQRVKALIRLKKIIGEEKIRDYLAEPIFYNYFIFLTSDSMKGSRSPFSTPSALEVSSSVLRSLTIL